MQLFFLGVNKYVYEIGTFPDSHPFAYKNYEEIAVSQDNHMLGFHYLFIPASLKIAPPNQIKHNCLVLMFASVSDR